MNVTKLDPAFFDLHEGFPGIIIPKFGMFACVYIWLYVWVCVCVNVLIFCGWIWMFWCVLFVRYMPFGGSIYSKHLKIRWVPTFLTFLAQWESKTLVWQCLCHALPVELYRTQWTFYFPLCWSELLDLLLLVDWEVLFCCYFSFSTLFYGGFIPTWGVQTVLNQNSLHTSS